MTTLLIVLLTIAFISGAPLFSVMLIASAIGALSQARGFEIEFDGMVTSMFGHGTGDQAQVLSTIPLFIYAGYVLAEAGTADRLVRFANAALGWIPGGLAIVTIGTCALFTVFTGASGVTIIALGGVLMPALVRVGYPEKFSVGLIAGTGSVGLLFPPALPLFIYGTVYGLTNLHPEIWDTRRFLFAGIVPGMVLVGMLSIVAVSVAVYKKLPVQKFSLGELGRSFLLALPELFVPFGVIGGLAAGIGLSEVAALTVVYVVIVEVGLARILTKYVAWGKPLDPRVLWTTTRGAMAMVGAIFMIIFASTVLTNFMVTAEVPKMLVDWTQAHVESKIVFLLAINLLLLVVGTVMDIFSAIVVVLPLIAPIAKAYGIDPYHLGVIFLLNLEVGYLHPPVGLNLFITSVKFQRPITEVMWATVPFLITMLVALLVVTYVPSLTVVPEAERTAPISNLVELVRSGVEESKVSVKEVTLVDATGKQLLKDGKPVVRKYSDCAALDTETARGICQQLFFDVTHCMPNPKAPEPAQQQCANEATAAWVVSNLNSDPLDLEKAIVIAEAEQVSVVDAEGNPVKDDKGAQVVKKFASCQPLTGTARETCRSLFIEVSSCHIKAHDCAADAPPECRPEAIASCVKDAIGSWVDEHPDEAKQP
jgi:C4-dicarboxylate transporter DctM subunit